MDPVIEALERAVAAAPQDLTLRLHLVEQLLAADDADPARRQAAVGHCATVLGQVPGDERAQRLMAQALGAPAHPAAPTPPQPAAAPGGGFDWGAAESQVSDVVGPRFVDEEQARPIPDEAAWDVERSTVTLADVGGMEQVKQRLDMSFLAPLRNPQFRRMYGKSLRGGLLLYGPPGCGKTFIARAVAGEMGASFISVGLSEILDMWIGSSERNVHELFQLARGKAPVVLFLDEIDALGQKRSSTRNTAHRGTVNQLLNELDGVDAANEGVFVLAATNQPWDVDPALRRPGRLDRTLLVLPPDRPARQAILHRQLAVRPVEAVDVARLARQTEGYSGADLSHLVESASEFAMMDGIAAGTPRMITMADLEAAQRDVRPSTREWFDMARNVVQFADTGGSYDDLRTYMKKHRLL